MKKLLLAPAVAVAITGFGVAPAIAASSGSFESVPAASAGTAAAEQPAPVPTSDPNVRVSPEVTAEDMTDPQVGVQINVIGAAAGSTASDSLVGDEYDVEENGQVAWNIYVVGGEPELGVTNFEITYTNAAGEETTVSASFEVVESYSGETEEPTEEPTETADPTEEPTETAEPTPTDTAEPTETAEPTATPTDDDDADVEYALEVDPQEISPADFVKQDKGVTLTATGLEAGEEVEFAVSAAGSNVESLTETATADENGVAVWSVYGIDDSNPSAYLGDYSVTVTNEAGETIDGSFTVTDSADNGEGGEDDNGDDRDDEGGSDLPRTGMELGGLAAGAALLTVGAATVVLSRRRSTKA
ncbi:MAG: hypothetical protein ACTHVO_04560 [Brevibacterium yomogidense]